MPKKTTTTTTTTTTRTTTNSGRSSSSPVTVVNPHYRFNAWVALMVLSLVALVAIISVTDDEKQQRNFKERWSLALSGISMCLAFFGSIGHAVFAIREKFVSSLVELAMAVICAGCWIFSIPMITSADEGLAVNNVFQVDDANLYFSSWGAFCFSLLLMASVGNERGVSASDGVTRRWLWLVISSLVVMAASSRMFDGVCDGNIQDGEFCKELKLGISLGVINTVMAGVMTLLLQFAADKIQFLGWIGAFCSFCMLILSAILVAYLTFDGGPASTVGNLFFGVWTGAIISLDLAVCYFMGWLRL